MEHRFVQEMKMYNQWINTSYGSIATKLMQYSALVAFAAQVALDSKASVYISVAIGASSVVVAADRSPGDQIPSSPELDIASGFTAETGPSDKTRRNLHLLPTITMREFKVVVLGSGGVGKSALTVQFVSGHFMEKYDPTVEDFYRKEIEVDGSPCVLEILDTAGTEQFASMRDLYIKNMKEQISRVKGSDRVPIMLVGNKVDLENQREVSSVEGMALAQMWGSPFLETSAKAKTNVNPVFSEIVREMNDSPEVEKGSYCCAIL